MSLLLQKITELHDRPGAKTLLDADLMLDYIRILYANTLEWRDELAAKSSASQSLQAEPMEEPAAEPETPVQEKPAASPEPAAIRATPVPPRPAPPAPPRPTPTAPPRPRAAAPPPGPAKPDSTRPVSQPAASQPAQQPTPPPAPQPPTPQPRPEFQQALGINDRLLIMNELFAGSGDHFREAMRLINESVDYHQATGRLHEATGLIHDEEEMNSDLFFSLLRRYFAQHAHSK